MLNTPVVLNSPVVLNTPVAYALQDIAPRWTTLYGMSTALIYDTAAIEHNRQQLEGITDVSCLQRFGVKGANAAAWLQQRALLIPQHSNSWLAVGLAADGKACHGESGVNAQTSLVLRLGNSEFMVEDQLKGAAYPALLGAAASHPIAAGVYKVQRNDAAFILSGGEALKLLSELCLLDLRNKTFAADSVLMTQLAGISVTLIRQHITTQQGAEQVYRIWCDGSYGPYLWETLTKVAAELGGGPVGLAHYL